MANARSRQLAYFKDNIQSQDDQDDFDASRYYYNRDDQNFTAQPGSMPMTVPSSPFVSGGGGVYSHQAEATSHATATASISAAQNQITFPPSSDLLAMLSRGVSFATNDISQKIQNPPDGDLPQRQADSAGAAQGPSELHRDNHRAPFDMSEFPALAGHANLEHAPPRESLNEISGLCADKTPASDAQMDTLTSPEIHGFPPNVLNNQYNLSDRSNFAMQSEDFPALPGSQVSNMSHVATEEYSNPICANSSMMQNLGLQGHLHGHSDAECSSQNPRALHNRVPPYTQSHIQQNKETLESMASRNLGAQALDSSCLETDSFGLKDKFNEMPANARSSRLSRDARIFNNSPPEHSIGTATRASQVVRAPKGNTDADNKKKYGLLGLLDVIRMTNADLNTLALGSDLTTLGLNLNSSECLYSTFASPWAEAPTTREPQFTLPLCYYMQPPPLKTSHLSKFQLETLFYIFYAMPRDVLQAYAAQELYNREWQYHQDLKLWFLNILI